jgi:hypothetical protein
VKLLDWVERRRWIRKREEPIPEIDALRLAVEEFASVVREELQPLDDLIRRMGLRLRWCGHTEER